MSKWLKFDLQTFLVTLNPVAKTVKTKKVLQLWFLTEDGGVPRDRKISFPFKIFDVRCIVSVKILKIFSERPGRLELLHVDERLGRRHLGVVAFSQNERHDI